MKPSTFSRPRQKDKPKACSCLTMHQVIKSKHQMRYQLGRWWKVSSFILIIMPMLSHWPPPRPKAWLDAPQGWSTHAQWLHPTGRWAATITSPCLGDSRTWNKLSGSMVSGQSMAFPVSPSVSDAQMDRWIAAATSSCSTNLTSHSRSPNLKSWLSHMGTYATSIQNTIANSTSLSNTGGQQNFGFVLLVMQGPLPRWRKNSLLALMMSWYSTSDSQFLSLLFSSVMSDTVAYRYANWSARFIHSYGEGLTGSQAAWANQKYHGHRTLPLEIVTQLKQAQFT